MWVRAQFGPTVSDALQSVSLQQAIGLTDTCSCMGKLWLLVVFRLLCYLRVFFFPWLPIDDAGLPSWISPHALRLAWLLQVLCKALLLATLPCFQGFTWSSVPRVPLPAYAPCRQHPGILIKRVVCRSTDCPVLCWFSSYGFNQGCKELRGKWLF